MKHPQFVVLVPVKAPALGKSRLLVPDHVRPGLATAFALDTLSAARETSTVTDVVVVTSDVRLPSALHRARDQHVARR